MRRNPLITINRVENAVDPTEILETTSDEFMMAFGVRSFDGLKTYTDPRYIKWVGRLWNVTEKGNAYSYYPLHRCSDDELTRFYDIEIAVKEQMENLHRDGGLYCLDWGGLKLDLYGSWRAHSHYNAIDIAFVPCSFKPSFSNGSSDWNRNDCVNDYKETL